MRLLALSGIGFVALLFIGIAASMAMADKDLQANATVQWRIWSTTPLPPEPLSSQSLPSLGFNNFNGGPKGKL